MLLNKKSIRVITLMLLVIGFASCSKYQRLLKSDDVELQYEKAVEYYYNEDYGRAIGLLTNIIPAFRGTVKAESINYYYAMAHFKQRDYALASHYFRSYANAFPRSQHAEEFLYLSAYCKYLESPRYSLDQTTTLQAIRELQNFTNKYPESERVEDANNLIDELRSKLERKRYNTAWLFMNISDYLAAATTFENLIRDYPDTEYREEAMFMIVKAHYEFAVNSIVERQEERFGRVLTAYNNLVRRYPESDYLQEATEMRDHANSTIAWIRQTNAISEN